MPRTIPTQRDAQPGRYCQGKRGKEKGKRRGREGREEGGKEEGRE
jgi:hypothetical protein